MNTCDSVLQGWAGIFLGWNTIHTAFKFGRKHTGIWCAFYFSSMLLWEFLYWSGLATCKVFVVFLWFVGLPNFEFALILDSTCYLLLGFHDECDGLPVRRSFNTAAASACHHSGQKRQELVLLRWVTLYSVYMYAWLPHPFIYWQPLIQVENESSKYHHIVQELWESRGGRPELSVLTSLLVSMDVKNYWTVLRHWSQLVPNMSTDIWGHKATPHLHQNITEWKR